MLSKKNRLPLRTEFKRIKKTGWFVNSASFTLLLARDKSVKVPRFGFIVSKKIDKKAAGRNRIRRYLAAAVKVNLDELQSNAEGVFLAKKKITEKNFSELKKEVGTAFSQADLIK